jgi:hypothetical protein
MCSTNTNEGADKVLHETVILEKSHSFMIPLDQANFLKGQGF